MVRNFLVRREGFLVLAAAALVLLLATAGRADTTTTTSLPDGGTRVTTTNDHGQVTKTKDTSKTSPDGVQTVTTTEYRGREGQMVKEEFKNGIKISRQVDANGIVLAGETKGQKWRYTRTDRWNENGQLTYRGGEDWTNGKQVRGFRSSYVYLNPKDKDPVTSTNEWFNPETQTWGSEVPLGKAEEKPKPAVPQQGLTKEDEAKAAKAMSEEKPKAAEPNPEVREEIGKLVTPGSSFYASFYGALGGIGPTHGLNLTSNEPDPTITSFRVPAKLATAATAGMSLGTWFGYPWVQLPPWASYFGFALGYTHYALQYAAEGGTYSQTAFFPGGATNATGNSTFRSNGGVDSLGFMFKGRYGWLPDDQMPLGRLETWAGVGPAIYFVSQRPTLRFDSITSVNGIPTIVSLNGYQKFSSASDTVVGLQVGVGASYYFFRWLSADGFLQYDHFTPSFNLTGFAGLTGKVTLPVDHFSINLGMSLHF